MEVENMNKKELDYANVDSALRAYIRDTVRLQVVDIEHKVKCLQEKLKFIVEVNND